MGKSYAEILTIASALMEEGHVRGTNLASTNRGIVKRHYLAIASPGFDDAAHR